MHRSIQQLKSWWLPRSSLEQGILHFVLSSKDLQVWLGQFAWCYQYSNSESIQSGSKTQEYDLNWHLFDFAYYWLRHQKNPDWSFIRSGGYFHINGKIFVPLHSWELTFFLVMGLGFFTQNWILALTTGVAHSIHFLQDIRAYKVRLLGYSFIYRYS